MESHSKKVYVNPNFNKAQRFSEIPAMHVNPAFSLQHHVASTSQKPRIHVNPNFVKAAPNDSQHVTSSVKESEHSRVALMNCSVKEVQPTVAPTSTKSRYKLVRHEQQRPIKKDIPMREKSTIAISKYKSVLVNDVKKDLSRTHPSAYNIQVSNSKSKVRYNNKFKFTRQTSVSAAKDLAPVSPKTIVQRPNTAKKSFPIAVNKYKNSKGAIGKLKKNNIPCPLYRKYGKCLRKDRGHCDYLHDKKHVCLCRKFLKGLCHNENCLFSHDLTSKKMPTCHFYLKGMCSKENCPYLHVKLNQNTKICPDFLKGYCEKGSECLKRHINKCPDMEDHGTCKKKQCPYPHKNKLKKEYTKTVENKPIEAKAEIYTQNQLTKMEQENTKDSRYYRDNIESSDSNCEIKPLRCKIGTLPSFIKL